MIDFFILCHPIFILFTPIPVLQCRAKVNWIFKEAKSFELKKARMHADKKQDIMEQDQGSKVWKSMIESYVSRA